MKELSKFLFLVVLVLAANFANAQATLSSTTLSADIDQDDTILRVASSSGITAGTTMLYIDREAINVLAVSGTSLTVSRGVRGTRGGGHVSGAIVYHGPPQYFTANDYAGSCTSTNELVLPLINIMNGNRFDCKGGVWIALNEKPVVAVFQQGATPADALDTIFFVADQAYAISGVKAVWGTAEVTGDMDIMVKKLTGTTACASGTNVLSAVIDASSNGGGGTANTTNTGSLSATASALRLAAGDRLCVNLTPTPNEIANMVVAVELHPIQ